MAKIKNTVADMRREMADLQRQLMETRAQLVHQYHFADANIAKAGSRYCMGGGVILSLVATGGREIIEPVCIKDGLSDATIEAIRADLRRSYQLAVEFKPKGVV